jgi:hypothetical protein
MRGIVDAIAQQYPSLTNHLVEMQDAFGFQRRGLDDLARLRGQEEADAMAAADMEEVSMDDRNQTLLIFFDHFDDCFIKKIFKKNGN